MTRYFLHLAYYGADYHGWQSQPNAVTVQETVEKALSRVLRRQMAIVGAGRTDTGVNARSMYAHFDVDNEIAEPQRLISALNSLVGRDIAIYGIRRVADDAHARFDAVARTYKYFVTTRKSPFDYRFAWNPPYRLDVDAMNAAAARLADYIDFTSFSKLHTDVATNNCRIYEARWTAESDRLTFTIKADRYLRNMVRAIVGTLVDVGRGKTSVDEFCRIIERKDRCAAGASVPGNALFLWQVDYPYEVD